MAEQHPEKPGAQEGFDREIGVRGIVRFAIGLALLSVVSGLVAWWVFVSLVQREERRDPPPIPIVEREGTPAVPEPRLQTSPQQDLVALRAEERALLEEYAWVDRGRGLVRIPVARSMDLVLQRGLPTRAGAPAWQRPAWRNPSLTRLPRTEVEP